MRSFTVYASRKVGEHKEWMSGSTLATVEHREIDSRPMIHHVCEDCIRRERSRRLARFAASATPTVIFIIIFLTTTGADFHREYPALSVIIGEGTVIGILFTLSWGINAFGDLGEYLATNEGHLITEKEVKKTLLR